MGYSRAVRVGDCVWVSGCTGTRPDGTVPETTIEQARVALDLIDRALLDAGSGIEDVVRARIYVTDIEEWESLAGTLVERFGTVKPAMTLVQVARLILPEHRIEIEVDAVIGSA